MVGCLVTGLLTILLFVIVPVPLWPILIIVLLVLFLLALAFGLVGRAWRSIFGPRR